MKGRLTRMLGVTLVLVLVLVAGASATQEAPQLPGAIEVSMAGNSFTYQGYLTDGGSPANGPYDFAFSLYADAAGTQWVGDAPVIHDVLVVGGLFTVEPDFTVPSLGDIHFYFNGEARYLRIGVRPGPSTGAFTYLVPLQPLTPTPYAQALPGLHTVQNDTSPNVVGGYPWNGIGQGVVGATIGGGGSSTYYNNVYADYGTVSGGHRNTANAEEATIGGGYYNTASGNHATVGGGYTNTASNLDATIAGGIYNSASGESATVAGGSNNSAAGIGGTVPGGALNAATGDWSFAAGRRAKALHTGAFVWADATAADFASSADNQFRVRANGGMDVVGSRNAPLMTVTNGGSGDGISVLDGVDGVQIGAGGVYPLYGLYIPSPGTTFTALWANTAVSTGEWGLYTPDKISASNVLLNAMTLLAVADGSQPLEAGTLVSASGLVDRSPQGGEPLPRVRVADSQEWTGVVGVVASRVALEPAPDKEELQLRSVDGPAQPGEYVAITVLGVARVLADPSASLSAGQRLTASSHPGKVRTLQARTVDGMVVVEGAPVVGVALGPVDRTTGLVPVMVTLR